MTKLPIVPTKTNFCEELVSLGFGEHSGETIKLYIDGNSKITCGNGTYASPKPNALSLPAASVDPFTGNGGDIPNCPGSTSVCRASCYVRGLAKAVPAQYAHYKNNAIALSYVLDEAPESFRTYAAFVLGSWITRNARYGFRWHVSGDVWDRVHADWIVAVCEASPSVRHWIYTRTFGVVQRLTVAKNLAVNVSADSENYTDARVAAAMSGARLCYMTDGDGAVPADLPLGSVIFPNYQQRGRDLPDPTEHPWWQSLTQAQRRMVCPTDAFGQSEERRCGPCAKCLVRA